MLTMASGRPPHLFKIFSITSSSSLGQSLVLPNVLLRNKFLESVNSRGFM
uniref:Uncharacterized protein n=1 Tax=Arundo donax TaxID=35708 RepID=A0A0A9BGQ3_ARUDO